MRPTPKASSTRPIGACFLNRRRRARCRPAPRTGGRGGWGGGRGRAGAEAGGGGAWGGVRGSMRALEAIREIVGFGEGLVGRLLMVDARAMRFETLNYAWDETNPLSGKNPAI